MENKNSLETSALVLPLRLFFVIFSSLYSFFWKDVFFILCFTSSYFFGCTFFTCLLSTLIENFLFSNEKNIVGHTLIQCIKMYKTVIWLSSSDKNHWKSFNFLKSQFFSQSDNFQSIKYRIFKIICWFFFCTNVQKNHYTLYQSVSVLFVSVCVC